jgi:hypothetical protein
MPGGNSALGAEDRLHGFFGVRFQWGYDLWAKTFLGVSVTRTDHLFNDAMVTESTLVLRSSDWRSAYRYRPGERLPRHP